MSIPLIWGAKDGVVCYKELVSYQLGHSLPLCQIGGQRCFFMAQYGKLLGVGL